MCERVPSAAFQAFLLAAIALYGHSSAWLEHRLGPGDVVWTAGGGSWERPASEVRIKWNGIPPSPPWRIRGDVLERWRADFPGLADVPAGVRHVAPSAFSGCRRLMRVRLPDGMETIGERAFHDCSQLREVLIPETVTNVGLMAFSDCIGLRLLVVPRGVEDIGDSAFSGCSRLRRIAVPDGVKRMVNAVFAGCARLDAVEFAGDASEVGRFPSIFMDASTNAVVAVRRDAAGWDWELGEWPYDGKAGRRRLVAHGGGLVADLLEGRGFSFGK